MDTPVIRYPFDPTGVNPNNLVVGEAQTTPARKIRAVAPEYGPFYTQSLVITDTATNTPLTADQYYCAELEAMASLETGFEVMRIIMITDQTVSNNLSLQYQVVGGEYSASATAIINQIYNLNLDDRPATWPSILGKPAAYPPSAHLHDAGDLFGFEYCVAALDRIRAAILLGDEASHDAIYQYIDLGTSQISGQIAALQAALAAHLADFGNPHRTTAAQVGAYTIAQSNANLTALQQTLQTNINTVSTALTAHENDFTNPHRTTAAQVGAYTMAQSDANLAAGLNSIKLGFTPVQQGGGANQQPNKVYLGWDGSRPRVQIDTTDLGGLITSNELTANVNNLQNNINTKAPANPGNGGYLYVSAGQNATLGSVTFLGNTQTNGTIFCSNDIWAFYSDERLKEEIEVIKDPLKKLHALDGVTYRHNELAERIAGADRSRRFMGLLAGQVKSVTPEITNLATFDRDPATGLSISGENYLTLQYEKVSALTVEGIKAVDRKLDAVIRVLKRAGLSYAFNDVEFQDVEATDLIPA